MTAHSQVSAQTNSEGHAVYGNLQLKWVSAKQRWLGWGL